MAGGARWQAGHDGRRGTMAGGARWQAGSLSPALTGSGHTQSMLPYLPYTVGDVADQGVAAAEASAAVLHLHARNPEDGSPRPDPALLGHDAKRLHVFHEMTSAGVLAATCELVFLHVSRDRVTPMPREAAAGVAGLAAGHAALPRPDQAGRRIAMPTRTAQVSR